MIFLSTASSVSRAAPRELIPALFTSMSTLPNACMASLALSGREDGDERSRTRVLGEWSRRLVDCRGVAHFNQHTDTHLFRCGSGVQLEFQSLEFLQIPGCKDDLCTHTVKQPGKSWREKTTPLHRLCLLSPHLPQVLSSLLLLAPLSRRACSARAAVSISCMPDMQPAPLRPSAASSPNCVLSTSV